MRIPTIPPALLLLDPTGHFLDGLSERRQKLVLENLLQAMGILPFWVDPKDPRGAQEQFEEKYDFGVYEMAGGKVDESGVYRFPDDPPLYPIGKMQHQEETIYFYQHAMVSIISPDGTTFTTRMD